MSKQIVELINKYQTDGYDFEYLDNTGRLIRCKDCDHCLNYGDCLVCNCGCLSITENDYCSKGEPKRNEND